MATAMCADAPPYASRASRGNNFSNLFIEMARELDCGEDEGQCRSVQRHAEADRTEKKSEDTEAGTGLPSYCGHDGYARSGDDDEPEHAEQDDSGDQYSSNPATHNTLRAVCRLVKKGDEELFEGTIPEAPPAIGPHSEPGHGWQPKFRACLSKISRDSSIRRFPCATAAITFSCTSEMRESSILGRACR